MANVGVKVRNANRLILIDSVYSNQALRFKSTYTINQGFAMGFYRQDFQFVCSSSATVAFRSNSDLAIYAQSHTGNVRTITLVSLVAQTFEYYVFDQPEYAPVSGIGFRIRNSTTNKIVFDSRLKYLKIKNFITQIPAAGASVSGIRKPAMITSQAYYEHQEEVFGIGPGGYDVLVIDLAGFINTSNEVAKARITSFYSQVESNLPELSSFVSGGFTIMVIDVMDY